MIVKLLVIIVSLTQSAESYLWGYAVVLGGYFLARRGMLRRACYAHYCKDTSSNLSEGLDVT